MEKRAKDGFDSSKLVTLAGLDKTPEQITSEYHGNLKKRKGLFWHLVRKRKAFLTIEKLINRPSAILLRAMSWSLYAICMIGLLISVWLGWIPPVYAVAFAAACCAGASVVRSNELKDPFLRSFCIVFGRTLLYFPLMPAVRLFDLYVAFKKDHPWVLKNPMPSEEVHLLPIAYHKAGKNLFCRLVRWRIRVLKTEDLIGRQRAIRLRTIGWSVYAIYTISVLTAVLLGWMHPIIAGLLAAGIAVALLSELAEVVVIEPVVAIMIAFMGAIAALGIGATIGWHVAGLAGSVVGILAGMIPIISTIPSLFRRRQLEISFLQKTGMVFGRLVVYFPLMPFIRSLDLWVARNQYDYIFTQPDALNLGSDLQQTERVKQFYLAGIAYVRERFLGDGSDLKRSLHSLEERRLEICSQRERVIHRTDIAESEKNPKRIEVLATLQSQLTAREERVRQAIDRLRGIVAKTDAFLLECEEKVNRLDGPLGDAELARTIQEGEDRDEEVIAQADRVIQKSVAELGNAVMRLHAVIESAALPAHTTDQDLTVYFGKLEAAAEEITELEVEAENPPEHGTVH